MGIDYRALRIDWLRRRVAIEPLMNMQFPIQNEIATLEAELRALDFEADEDLAESWVDEKGEEIENLIGLAFVAAQVYLVTVRAAYRRLVDGQATDPFTLSTSIDPNSGRSGIETINDIANFWKHREDWKVVYVEEGEVRVPRWKPEKKNEKATVETAERLGLVPRGSHNMRTALKNTAGDLLALRTLLERWGLNLVDGFENRKE